MRQQQPNVVAHLHHIDLVPEGRHLEPSRNGAIDGDTVQDMVVAVGDDHAIGRGRDPAARELEIDPLEMIGASAERFDQPALQDPQLARRDP